MSLVREMAEYVQDLGHGTLVTNIFVGELPNSPDNAILLTTAPSDPPDLYLETQYLTIDIWSRNTSTANGYTVLEDIHKDLHRRQHFELTNYYVHFVHALSEIEDFEKDEQRRKLLKLPIRCIYRNLSLVS